MHAFPMFHDMSPALHVQGKSEYVHVEVEGFPPTVTAPVSLLSITQLESSI